VNDQASARASGNPTSRPVSHYDVLGVSPSDSRNRVRQAFRDQARRHHPDHNPSLEAPAHLHRILEAWQVLGDDRDRADYDLWLAQHGATPRVEVHRRTRLPRGRVLSRFVRRILHRPRARHRVV
jgi:curved DNA-binding protein CbpA